MISKPVVRCRARKSSIVELKYLNFGSTSTCRSGIGDDPAATEQCFGKTRSIALNEPTRNASSVKFLVVPVGYPWAFPNSSSAGAAWHADANIHAHRESKVRC